MHPAIVGGCAVRYPTVVNWVEFRSQLEASRVLIQGNSLSVNDNEFMVGW